MIKNTLNRIKDRYYLHHDIFPFVKRNKNRVITKENTICLFSHQRSGSTWLAEILLQIPNSCLIDEPLQLGKIKGQGLISNQNYRDTFNVKDRRFYDEQPIPINAEWLEAEKLVADIIGGRIDSLSLYDETGPKRLKNANIYIVKFNFGHLLSNWLINKFSVNSIMLFRHPCAVVASQLKIKPFKAIDFTEKKEFPDFRYKVIIEKYDSIYKTLNSFEEYLAFMWSIKIKEALFQKNYKNDWLNVAYESLVTNFENETQRIFKWIDKDLPEKLTDLQFKPSISTKFHSIERIKTNQQLKAWENDLSKKQIKEILNIVEKFEIDIYSTAPEPDYDILYSL